MKSIIEKSDPLKSTWVIAFDLNLNKIKESLKDINKFDQAIFDINIELETILNKYNFKNKMLNNIYYNHLDDATKSFAAISLGLNKSWAKIFIEKINIFKINENSNANDLLELNQEIQNKPIYFK